ncbi:MAG: ATP-binding cassette domain-containing protein [Candidatus Jidaibacter sp.]|jgi:phospholipid/cholesterol/gamma-HCH transport system ATP-binding protein|nr:ATP-binding cassette domain-containing protein [Candidatus Jidaibacter sp.]
MSIHAKITAKNLSKSFGAKKVLDNISFSVEKGESFVIMGGSGTGKSVLIKSIIGLVKPDMGSSVLIDGHDITYLPIDKRGELINRCGVLFQGGALFDSLRVWENICFTMLQQSSIDKKQARDLALKKLQLVGLDELALDLYPAELSGGMVKRVALARAIAMDPEIIFFDEPTAGLDPIMSGVISELIKSCSKQLGATTITITHDMNCASRIADKAALLYQGNFIWYGEGGKISNSGNEFVEQFVHGKPEGPITNSKPKK